jgi:MFS family permease
MSTTTSPRPTLRSFWEDLPREGRMLLSIVALQFIGSGLVMPFQVVYLHQVRHIPLGTTGLLLALPPLGAFLATGPAGAAIDRIGARIVLLTTLVLMILGDLTLVVADDVPRAAVGLTLLGIGQGISWPASNALVAAVIPPGQQQRYFGLNFTLLNLGFGIGGVLGGVVVDVHKVWTCQGLFIVDAVGYLPAIALLVIPLRHIAGRPAPHPEAPKASYAEVVRRPAVPTMLLLGFAAAFVGYAQLSSGFTAFATSVAGASTHAIGFAFALNTLVIVVLQMLVLQRIEGRRRTRVIAVMAAVWTCSWLLLGAAGVLHAGAAVLVCLSAGVFGLGETLLQPTIPTIVNDLADDHVRGRFNALSSAMMQLPSMVAPPIAGVLIAGPSWVYIALLVLGCAVVGWLAIGRLEPQLPDSANGLRVAPDVLPVASGALQGQPGPGVD